MNDFIKLTNLLQELGIPYSSKFCGDDHFRVYVGQDSSEDVIFGTNKDKHNKIGGYPGFYTRFLFDADGKFLNVGAWE